MDIKWVKDKLKKRFYPIAHIKSVIVDSTKTLDVKLSELDSEIEGKAEKDAPVFTGSMSMGRKIGSTTGAYSTAEGYNPTASVEYYMPKEVKRLLLL